jgi:hypothetical protein
MVEAAGVKTKRPEKISPSCVINDKSFADTGYNAH